MMDQSTRRRDASAPGRNRVLRWNAAFMRQRPARFNVLPDKSGVPAETMRLNFSQYQGTPGARGTRAPDLRRSAGHGKLKV
jgi:hypothetical protein